MPVDDDRLGVTVAVAILETTHGSAHPLCFKAYKEKAADGYMVAFAGLAASGRPSQTNCMKLSTQHPTQACTQAGAPQVQTAFEIAHIDGGIVKPTAYRTHIYRHTLVHDITTC